MAQICFRQQFWDRLAGSRLYLDRALTLASRALMCQQSKINCVSEYDGEESGKGERI
jgi:hypothetical protein